MNKLLVLLLSFVISHEAAAFGKKVEDTPKPTAVTDVAAPTPAFPVPTPATMPAKPKTTKPIPVTPPKTAIVVPESTVEIDGAFENLGNEEEVKPAPKVIKKGTKKVKPKPVAPIITFEKKKELETLTFLKNNPWCGKSAIPGVSTTGDANSLYRIRNNYTEKTLPPSVKKLIDQQVDQCDKEKGVGKYYIKPRVEQPAPVVVSEPVAPAPAEGAVGDSAKKVGDFFNKLGSDITKNGVKEKVCSPGETQMHVNGC